MAELLPANYISPTVTLEIGGPVSYLITPVAALVSVLVWGHVFNATIILIRDAKQTPGRSDSYVERVLGDWFQFLFFPFTLIFRWAWFGTSRAIGSHVRKQAKCSWFTRLLLGSAYCDALDRMNAAIASGKAAFAGTLDENGASTFDPDDWLCRQTTK